MRNIDKDQSPERNWRRNAWLAVCAGGFVLGLSGFGLEKADADNAAKSVKEAAQETFAPGKEKDASANFALSEQDDAYVDTFTNLTPEKRAALKMVIPKVRAAFASGKKFNPPHAVADAMVQTEWGTKVVGNNWFGIKKGSWQGDTVQADTWEETQSGEEYDLDNETFRAYGSFEESLDNFIDMVNTKPWYQDAVEGDGYKDYQHFTDNLVDDWPYVHATADHYRTTVEQIIEKYDLDRLAYPEGGYNEN